MKRFLTLLLSLLFVVMMLAGPAAVSADMSDTEIKSLLLSVLEKNMSAFDYKLDVENGNVVLRAKVDGITPELVKQGKYNSEIQSSWVDLREAFTGVSTSILTLLQTLGVENGSVSILLVDDTASKSANVFLYVVNGIITVDVYA